MDAQVERLREAQRTLNSPTLPETRLSLDAGQSEEQEAQEFAVEFPVGMLPPVLRQFVEAVAETLPVPPDLVALPTLVAAGAAIGNSRRIQLKESWTEPAAIYGAIVSRPGSLKTPALDAAVAPIRAADIADSRTWTADVTVERFGTLLQQHPRGLCLIVDELSAWVKSMNQYKGGNGADKQFYLSAWSGTEIIVDRVKNPEPIRVPRPFVSVIGCIPPDVLPDLAPDKGKEDGFIHRVLFAWPEPLTSRWNNNVVPQATERAYHKLLAALYRLKLGHVPLPLTDEARQRWVRWHDAHLAESDSPVLSPYLQGAYAKLKGYGARVALIHALCCDPAAKSVGAESVIAAVTMADYFKVQAAKVDEALCRYVGTPKSEVEGCKEKIIRNTMMKRDVKKRDIQRNVSYPADIFNVAWDFLTNAQLISINGVHWNLRSLTDIPTPTT